MDKFLFIAYCATEFKLHIVVIFLRILFKLQLAPNQNYCQIRGMFHVYLNRFKFHFLRLHINKASKFCFFMHNIYVPGIAKKTRWQFKA